MKKEVAGQSSLAGGASLTFSTLGVILGALILLFILLGGTVDQTSSLVGPIGFIIIFLLLGFGLFGTLVFSIIGLTFSIIQNKNGKTSASKKGLILSIIGIILGIIIIILAVMLSIYAIRYYSQMDSYFSQLNAEALTQ